MNSAVLLLGTNIGNRSEALRIASQLIVKDAGPIVRKSPIYETAPWGNTDQAPFLNQAMEIETELFAAKLLKTLLQIEKEMGRLRLQKWEPRLIDIDILFYNSDIIKEADLTIPHPLLQERRFALVPLAEMMPTFIHPVFKSSIHDLLRLCIDQQQVKLYI